MRSVSYARSTYRKAHEFQRGIEELSKTMPLSVARAYLCTGAMTGDFAPCEYARVEELQELRKAAIAGEMRYVYAQVKVHGAADSDLVKRVAECKGCSDDAIARLQAQAQKGVLDAEELFGPTVISGDDIRFGFGSEALALAPSLGVYELVMWTTVDELTSAKKLGA